MSYRFIPLSIWPNQMARAEAALRAEFGASVGVDSHQGNRFAYVPNHREDIQPARVAEIIKNALLSQPTT